MKNHQRANKTLNTKQKHHNKQANKNQNKIKVNNHKVKNRTQNNYNCEMFCFIYNNNDFQYEFVI